MHLKLLNQAAVSMHVGSIDASAALVKETACFRSACINNLQWSLIVVGTVIAVARGEHWCYKVGMDREHF